jgi:hypothetical protein
MTSIASVARPAALRLQLKHIAFAVFALMAVFVLYGRDLQLLNPASELRQRYAAVPWWMLAHGIFGALALFVAPFQFSNRLRYRNIRLHRIMGRLYVAGVLVAAPAAIPVASSWAHLNCSWPRWCNPQPGCSRRALRSIASALAECSSTGNG